MFRRFFKTINPEMEPGQLKPGQVLDYLQSQAEGRSGYAANKDRKNLVAAWNWGIKYLGLPQPNPCLVDRFPEERHPRYVPPEEDFWAVWEVAEDQDKVILAVALYLGARRGEIFRLTWADIDFGQRRARLGTRKRQDGSLEYDWLPMTDELASQLSWWRENRPIRNTVHVFVCSEETPFCQSYYGQPFQYRQHFMRKLCERAGVKAFGLHAIRHLTASILYQQGQPVSIIQAVLRHKSPNTTTRYLRSLGVEETRSALEGLNRSAKVVEFRKKPSKVSTSEG